MDTFNNNASSQRKTPREKFFKHLSAVRQRKSNDSRSRSLIREMITQRENALRLHKSNRA